MPTATLHSWQPWSKRKWRTCRRKTTRKHRNLSVASDVEEDSLAWDLLRAGAFAGKMAGKAAFLGGTHIGLPMARGAASLAWRAGGVLSNRTFVPGTRDESLARSPDGGPSNAGALPPQPTPGSAARKSEGFRPLAILNREIPEPESQQPISWPRVSEVYKSIIVGNSLADLRVLPFVIVS